MATLTEVQNYISSVRAGVSDFVDNECRKERLGHVDMFRERQNVILATAYLEIVTNYFTPFLVVGVDDGSYEDDNFFTKCEIKDVMQHINNICDTFYTLNL
jgi:hypothetical protein